MDKPATITAKDFVEQGYAEKIARGECVVTFSGGVTPIIGMQSYNLAEGLYCLDWKGGGGGSFKDSEQFIVTWQPATPPVATESAATGQGAGTPATVYKFNKPTHLIANQLIRDIETYLYDCDVKVQFGKGGHALIEDFLSQLQDATVEAIKPDVDALQAEIATLRTALDAAQEREAGLREALEEIAKPYSNDYSAEYKAADRRYIAKNALEATPMAKGKS